MSKKPQKTQKKNQKKTETEIWGKTGFFWIFWGLNPPIVIVPKQCYK